MLLHLLDLFLYLLLRHPLFHQAGFQYEVTVTVRPEQESELDLEVGPGVTVEGLLEVRVEEAG